MNVDLALPILVSTDYIIVVAFRHEKAILLVWCVCIDVVALGSLSKARQAIGDPETHFCSLLALMCVVCPPLDKVAKYQTFLNGLVINSLLLSMISLRYST